MVPNKLLIIDFQLPPSFNFQIPIVANRRNCHLLLVLRFCIIIELMKWRSGLSAQLYIYWGITGSNFLLYSFTNSGKSRSLLTTINSVTSANYKIGSVTWTLTTDDGRKFLKIFLSIIGFFLPCKWEFLMIVRFVKENNRKRSFWKWK